MDFFIILFNTFYIRLSHLQKILSYHEDRGPLAGRYLFHKTNLSIRVMVVAILTKISDRKMKQRENGILNDIFFLKIRLSTFPECYYIFTFSKQAFNKSLDFFNRP